MWSCASGSSGGSGGSVAGEGEEGCTGSECGVESVARSILGSVKGVEKEQVREACTAAVSDGIATVCSFLVPFADETSETLRESLEFMAAVHEAGARIYLSYTCPFPGTAFYEQAAELGLTILTDDWGEFDAKHVVIETRNLAAHEIETTTEAMAASLGMKKSAV